MSRVKRPVGSKRKNGQGPVAVKAGCARQPVAPATLNCTSEPERRLQSRVSQTARSSGRNLCVESARRLPELHSSLTSNTVASILAIELW